MLALIADCIMIQNYAELCTLLVEDNFGELFGVGLCLSDHCCAFATDRLHSNCKMKTQDFHADYLCL